MFANIDTYLLWHLTGRKVYATDYSCASVTGLYDPYQVIMVTIMIIIRNIIIIIIMIIRFVITIRWFMSCFCMARARTGATYKSATVM